MPYSLFLFFIIFYLLFYFYLYCMPLFFINKNSIWTYQVIYICFIFFRNVCVYIYLVWVCAWVRVGTFLLCNFRKLWYLSHRCSIIFWCHEVMNPGLNYFAIISTLQSIDKPLPFYLCNNGDKILNPDFSLFIHFYFLSTVKHLTNFHFN